MTNGSERALRRLFAVGAAGLLIAIGYWSALRAGFALTHGEFVDEASQIVRGRQILAGFKLYQDVFAHKAPGAMIVTWLAALTGAETLADFRRWTAGLYALAVLAIAASPILHRLHARMIAAALALAALSAFSVLWSGQMVHYKVLAGALISLAMALAVVPAMQGRPVDGVRGALGGFALGLLPSMVLTYALPALIGLALAFSGRWGRGKPVRDGGTRGLFIGFAIGLACWIGWIGIFGSFGAFYAFNVTFNATIYAEFMAGGPINPLQLLARSLSDGPGAVDGGAYLLAFGALVVSAACLCFVRGDQQALSRAQLVRGFIQVCLLALLFFALNPRGGCGIHSAACYGLAICMCALALGQLTVPLRPMPWVAAVFLASVALILGKPVFEAGQDVRAALAERGPAEEWLRGLPSSRAILAVTDPGERVGIYPFVPTLHVATGRMPASAIHQYLPWQAAWDAQRGEGVRLCEELTADPPPMILISHHPVWGEYYIRDYAPCLLHLVTRDYVAIDDDLLRSYVRRDRVARAHQAGFDALRGTPVFNAVPLGPDFGVKQYLHVPVGAQVLQVRLATYTDRAERGVAIAVLDTEGRLLGQRSLEAREMVDNGYARIELEPGHSGPAVLMVEGSGAPQGHPAAVWTISPALDWYDVDGAVERAGICYQLLSDTGEVLARADFCPPPEGG